MDTLTLLLIGHIIGSIIGVGGATYIEIHLNMALSDGSMDAADRRMMGVDFLMTRIGLALSFLTGLGFIALYISHGQWFRLYDGVFWAKMLIIAILIVNAILLHKHKIGLYWGSAFSFVSWWAAFFLGMFLTNNVKVVAGNNVMSFIVVMGIYATIVVCGAWLLHQIRNKTKVAPIPSAPIPPEGASPEGQSRK